MVVLFLGTDSYPTVYERANILDFIYYQQIPWKDKNEHLIYPIKKLQVQLKLHCCTKTTKT